MVSFVSKVFSRLMNCSSGLLTINWRMASCFGVTATVSSDCSICSGLNSSPSES